MRRALLLLALAACGDKKDAPPAAGSNGTPAGTGYTVEPLGRGDHLAFVIDEVAADQIPTEAPPWHAAGGDYTYVAAHLAADPQATLAFALPDGASGLSEHIYLVPTTADAGARVVAAYAKTFGVAVPPVVAGMKLAPVQQLVARIGDHLERDKEGGFTGPGTWDAMKLFCEAGGVDGAEVFFNVDFAGKQGEFAEKDADDDADVARCLAMLLRDGVPPPRSAANDPTLAAAGPTVAAGKRIAPINARAIAATPERVVFTVPDGETDLVTAVSSTGAATELYRTKDRIEPGGACGGATCAIVTRNDDKRSSRVVILAGGKPIEVTLDAKVLFVPAVSPDGKQVIVRTDWTLAAIDVATGRLTHLTQPAAFSDNFDGWSDRPGVARVSRSARDQVQGTSGTWDVRTSGAMTPVPTVAARPLRSPGGKREITVADNGVVTVVAGGAPRTFTLDPHDRGAASPDCCTWIDDRWLLMTTESAQVWIDSDALKVSPIPDEAAYLDVVPGTHAAVARGKDGWHLATITPPP